MSAAFERKNADDEFARVIDRTPAALGYSRSVDGADTGTGDSIQAGTELRRRTAIASVDPRLSRFRHHIAGAHGADDGGRAVLIARRRYLDCSEWRRSLKHL